ncbi:MAG: inter-alpha-trypsin inhibitor heavy chain H2 [precursor] [Pirellulaceae bacterium]|nr:MAG: inter-alpha-trypsin inhibitor heavy chain H2 [precursor] [Pirellulaceae bacterium]
MGFLAPWFAAAFAALAVPVLLHLVRRTPRGQVRFSSLMFLSPSPPRLTRRSRLEHWWLLLLRLVALSLIAVAFTRPFWRERAEVVSEPTAAHRVLLLLDTSASMRREGVWEEALRQARQLLDSLPAHDQAALWTFDKTVRPVVDFDAAAGRDVLRAELEQLRPTWQNTDLGTALLEAAERLTVDESPYYQPRIVLISDLQEGCRLESLRSASWPHGVQLVLRRVAPRSGQASLQLLPPDSQQKGFRFRIRNDRASQQEVFRLSWFRRQDGQRLTVGTPQSVYVPPGQSRIVTLALPDSPVEGAELHGDTDPFADVVYIAPIAQRTVPVLFIGNDNDGDPNGLLFYVVRGLVETPGRRIQLDHQNLDQAWQESLHNYRLVVLGGSPPAESWKAIADWVEQGGALLMVCRTVADAQAWAGQFLPDLDVAEGSVADYLLWSDVDFSHPIFAPLDDPRYRDFTKIRFWKYRRLQRTGEGQVVVRFDNGDPALLEYRHGEGRMLLLASSWQPSDSQWAVSTKWVPFLEGCLEWCGIRLGASPVTSVGMPLPVTWSIDDPRERIVVQTPGDETLTYSLNDFLQEETTVPGLYRVRYRDQEQLVGVNLDAGEIRTDAVDPTVLEQLGVQLGSEPDAMRQESARRQARDQELEKRQRLWQWLLASAVAVLFLETWLAGRLMRNAGKSGPHDSTRSDNG